LACFGAGCYWGTEKYFAKNFEKQFPGSILGTSVGFMNPDKNAPPNPEYEEVCDGTTGYVEVAYIMFDNTKATYEQVVRHFFTFHDPTTNERQGNDAGSQYTSAIFYYSES